MAELEAEVERLQKWTADLSASLNQVKQTLGKELGYPMYGNVVCVEGPTAESLAVEISREVERLRAELAAKSLPTGHVPPRAEPVVWVENKDDNGNSVWVATCNGVTLEVWPFLCGNEVHWRSMYSRHFMLADAKAAVEASLAPREPETLTVWVSRDRFSDEAYIWDFKPEVNSDGLYFRNGRVGSFGKLIPSFSEVLGIYPDEGQCIEVRVSPGKVVRV